MPCVAVATSGGRDSTALLHATAHAAARLGGLRVMALHVHHGLHPAADAWLRQVRRQCARWAAAGLPLGFDSRRLSGQPAAGESIEAWARRERYKALAEMASGCGATLVLLGHHQADQAETFLLQALRGAGAAGLAAMPARAERVGIVWARPWLAQPASAVQAYLQRYRLAHVQDPSNADPRFARSRLRQQVMPALQAAFEDLGPALGAAAAQMAQAQQCLQELGQMDLQGCTAADGGLRIGDWAALSAARRANALREWLRAALGRGGPESLLQRLLRELPRPRAARWPAGDHELCSHDGVLRLQPAMAPLPSGELCLLDLSRPGRHELPRWGGCLEMRRVDSGGIAATLLAHSELRPRGGGEQFQQQPRSLPRALKKQFQALRVPAWQRSGPLLFVQGQLAFVPGLGVDARCQAAVGTPQLLPVWRAHSR